jgi:SagB-type dehydrogenase family enzyme
MARGLVRRRFLQLAAQAFGGLLAAPGFARAQEKARAIHEATRNTLRGAVGVHLRQLFDGRPAVEKPYPGVARTPLPAATATSALPARSLAAVVRDYRPASGFDGEKLPFATLARLLEAANGVTGRGPGGTALRAAPSAGALYAGEIYVACERVQDLVPGLYYYSPLTRALARLREGPQLAELVAALEEPGRGQAAAAAVVLTNVFARYRWRYANRGYRYALIDSGHIGENLRLATTSAGLAEWGPLRFHDDRLNALLEINGVDEAVCAVHLLGSGASSQVAPVAPKGRRLVEAAEAGRALPVAADDAPERYHAWTKLVPPPDSPRATDPAEASAPPLPSAPERTPDPTAASGISLPSRIDPGMPVEQVIRRRRSARVFQQAPISAADLGYVLDAAHGHAPLRRSASIEILVFVHRIAQDGTDVAPGLYRAPPGARALELVRRGDFSARLALACLGQEKAETAAAGIAMVGDLEAAARRGGDRSYRDLCLEAGAIGQRVYLAAGSVGLAARNLAAFVDERLNELAEVDSRRRAVLHLTMLGPGR